MTKPCCDHCSELMLSALYVSATVYLLQASGVGKVGTIGAIEDVRRLAYIQRALREMADTWPAATQSVESLARLQQEYCL